MTAQPQADPVRSSLPPRIVIRAAWIGHRALYRLTGGRRGLWTPNQDKWGTMLLTSTGRRSGKQREAILAYFEDGPNLVTLAMNGWGAPEPAWWLNLQANPDASVRLKGREIPIHARIAEGDERARLWPLFAADGYAGRRPTETAVVILEPRA
jgi:deazaflavin-dependent oxidoreductase (nitroreductase family)